MSVYKIEFTTKGSLEIAAPNQETAYEMAVDIVDGMSSKTFYYTFSDEVEVNNVECIEEDVNCRDCLLDIG